MPSQLQTQAPDLITIILAAQFALGLDDQTNHDRRVKTVKDAERDMHKSWQPTLATQDTVSITGLKPSFSDVKLATKGRITTMLITHAMNAVDY